ncbi:MAG TPA: acyltransferase, partial [Acidobacteriaceae bacterium]
DQACKLMLSEILDTGRPSKMFSKTEIRSLTGLRGVAAVFVVFYHYTFGVVNFGPGLLKTIEGHGYMAVDLFFVLSGFVITLTNSSGFLNGFAWKPYLVFLYKRLGRTYPLYLLIVLASMALRLHPGGFSRFEVVTNLLLIQAWGFAISIGGPAWSISTEFAAYLLFPLMVMIVPERRRAAVIACATLAVAMLLFLSVQPENRLHVAHSSVGPRHGPLDIYDFGTVYPLLRCIAGFLLGVIGYRLSLWRPVRRIASAPGAGDAVVVLLVCLAALRGSDIAIVLTFVPLIITLPFEQSYASRLLGSAPVYWFGLISYSLYLVHSPLYLVANPGTERLLGALHVPHLLRVSAVVVGMLTTAVSAVTYYWWERPMRNLSRSLISRHPPTMRMEPAAP